MTERQITISDKMAGEIERALNLAIGMALLHCEDSVRDLIELANRLTDTINGEDHG